MKYPTSGLLLSAAVAHCGAIFCATLLFDVCVFADDWQTYQHDSAHTGRSTATYNPALLKKAWGVAEFAQVFPIVAGNSLYEIRNNSSNTVSSFNLISGQKNWSTNLSITSPSPATYAEGLLFFTGLPTPGTGSKLYVLDAASGAQKYTVDLPAHSGSLLLPTVARNSNNDLVAYVASGSNVSAISIGANAGTLMWTGSGSIGGFSIPTVVGNSVILAGPTQYYAFDQLTGAANHFYIGPGSGGGGVTVPFDAVRSQFYVRDEIGGFLTAYSYTSNSVINQKWQIPISHFSGVGSVSIGADGSVYMVSQPGSISKLDPDDGHVLQSLSGLSLSTNITPALSATSVFLYGDASSSGTTEIFDINTLAHLASLPRGRGDASGLYSSPGAIFDNGYVLFYITNTSTYGFDVYLAIPEPSTILLATAAFAGLTMRRRKTVPHNRV